jgi:hypothetical protein
MRRLLATALCLSLAASLAHATFPFPPPPPGTPPQRYADYLRLPATSPPVRPSEFVSDGIAWKLTSERTGEAAIDADPQELFGVKGMSVDLAWQVTTGRPDVVIAVLDSGIEWNDAGAMADLRRKVRLNRGELPPPTDATGQPKPPGLNPDPYDFNDDGVFDVTDYAADPRLADANANGLLDPQDLILLLSDGTDADANGYVDDIAGWNFLDDDNDPLDEVQYGHGTGQARDSTAEADNGGDLGTCPNCMVLPVRVGDSFVADSNLFAQGVVFAVDSGAHVVQEALGTVNNSSFARAAIEYAYANDVPVIASAADEESFHHNFPAANRHTVTVNSVTRFANQSGLTMSPRSYLYLNGCTNYGGNIAVAVSSSSCSSEATGRGAGLAGLLVSAALDRVDAGQLVPRRVGPTGAVHPLSANEIAQLLTMTADDVDFTAHRAVAFFFASMRYASQPGWDQYFGHGRANAARAVAAAGAGEFPPEADLLEPDWWRTLDPVRAPAVTVTGAASAPHAASFGFELAFGCGVQPAEGGFHPIAAADGLTAPLAPGPLDIWSIADAAATCAFDPSATPEPAASGTPSPGDTPDAFTVTLRLRVTDAAGRRGEARRTVYLHHDPDLLSGHPRPLGGSAEASPLFATLRARAPRDGGPGARPDLLLPTSDGTLSAIQPGGKVRKGWPVRTDPLPLHGGSRAFVSGALPTTFHESIGNGVAAADLDGDGRTEVVAGSLGGKLYVWEGDGSRRPGFPVTTDPRFSARNARDRFNRLQRGLLAAPVLVDLDGDGALEIVAAAMDRHLYAWRADATVQPGFPVLVVDRTQMASIDPVSHRVVPRTVGSQPVALQGTKIVSTPAVGALRPGERPTIVVGTNEEYREAPHFSSLGNTTASTFIALGLLSRANGRVYAIPAGGSLDPTGAGNPAGPFLPGWPARIAVLVDELLPWIEGVPGAPALADVDGDGTLEVGIAAVVGPAYVLRADGTSFYGTGPDGLPVTLPTDESSFGPGTTSTDGPSLAALGSGSFARLGSEGRVAFVIPASGLGRLIDTNVPAEQLPNDDHIDAWDALTGTFLPAFPRLLEDLAFLSNPAVADVDGDDAPEILLGSGGYLVHAVDAAGVSARGWPKFTGNWIIATPAVARFGTRTRVAVTTREGNLFIWRARGSRSAAPWPRYHGDLRNSGRLD